MNRKQMIDFINDEVLPGAEIADWEWMKHGREIVGDSYIYIYSLFNIIFHYGLS